MEILRVDNLRVHFHTRYGVVRAVEGVSFGLQRGETLGIVGESGVGKSVTALSVLGLAWRMGARLVSGEVWYAGQNLFAHPEFYGQVRGRKIGLIPQEAGAALNPVLTVGDQLGEMMAVHLGLAAGEARLRTAQLLEEVELPDPVLLMRLYPYQLSGGILQRVLLAMALCCSPELLIADEPASSLDTTIQARILELLRNIRDRHNLSIILITHDLGVISRNCDRLLVMYGGRILEAGPAPEIIRQPLHPYTAGLLEIYRWMEQGAGSGRLITGHPLSPYENVPGCTFAHRCRRAAEVCRVRPPQPLLRNEHRLVACHQQ